MPTMAGLEAMSHRHRERKCKIAEALTECDDADRLVWEEAIDNSKITDDAIRKEMQADGIAAMADAAGPQSVTYHRSRRCICFDNSGSEA